jgi:hypothetical protein
MIQAVLIGALRLRLRLALLDLAIDEMSRRARLRAFSIDSKKLNRTNIYVNEFLKQFKIFCPPTLVFVFCSAS